jgi:hypothetical protein
MLRFSVLTISFLLLIFGTEAAARDTTFNSGVDVKRFVDEWSHGNASGASAEEAVDISFFQGYVNGLMDGIYGQFCPPARLTIDQSISVIQKYLDNHPEQWGRNRAYLVRQALVTAFPCGK